MSNTVKLGREMFIVYNGQAIAKATSYSLSISKSEIDISSLDSDGWSEKLGDSKEWSIDFDGLVTRGTISGTTHNEMTGTTHVDFDALLSQFKANDTPVEVAIVSKIVGDKYEVGTALLTSLSVSGAVSGAITYSGTLSGSGALVTKTVTV